MKINMLKRVMRRFIVIASIVTIIATSLITATPVYADAVDLYWVNGTGNYSDPNHWATIYTTGTATFVNASTTVEGGGGCNWTGLSGQIRVASTGTWYTIASITDADTLELTGAFSQANTGAVTYVIATTGHAAPTSTNNVYFNIGSFSGAGQIVTIDAGGAECKSMDWTGATNTPTLESNNTLIVGDNGNVTFIAAMVMTGTGGNGIQLQGAGNHVITSNGLVWTNKIYFDGAGTTTFADNFTSTKATGAGGVYLLKGTLDTNGKTVTTTGNFTVPATAGVARVLTLGSSVINCNGSFNILDTTDFSLTANTATINVGVDFAGAGLVTFNTVNLTGATSNVTGSNTFSILALPSGTTQTIRFQDGTTQTATTFTLSGSSGHVHTLRGSVLAGWSLSDAAGVNNYDYISVSRSTAGGGATFNANGASVNGGNNVGWNFPLTTTTQAATNVSMDKDGNTSVTMNGTVVDMGGSANDTAWFDYGLTALYGSTTTAQPIASPSTFNSDSFTLALISDPQNEVETFQAIWEAQMQWVATNKTNFNIQAVIGLGDNTNGGNDARMVEAKVGWDKIKAANLPYIINLGNHDYDASDVASRNATFFNTYFGTAYYTGQTWYGGSLNNKTQNSYYKLDYGNYKYLILNLETYPPDSVLAWAQGIITANPTYNVILVTHGYLDTTGALIQTVGVDSPTTYGVAADNSGQDMWDEFVKVNSNIIAVFCGHRNPVPFAQTLNANNNAGYPVAQFMFDYQDHTNGGNGNVILMTINPITNKMSSTVYEVNAGAYYSGGVYNLNYTSQSLTALGSLNVGATYHYRSAANNGVITANGSDQTFTFTMPSVTTGSSSQNGFTTNLSGNISSMGVATSTYAGFQWGYDTSYGHTATLQTRTAIGNYTTAISGYNPNNTIHYRAYVTNGSVTSYGADGSFIPEGTLPATSNVTNLFPLLFGLAGILIVLRKMAQDGATVQSIIIIVVIIMIAVSAVSSIQSGVNGIWGG